MRKITKKIFLLCSILFATFTGELIVKASTPSYYISPAFSEHQSKNVATFFDVKWTPNKSDKIGITITNTSDKNKNFEIRVNKARTNGNGITDYSDNTKESLTSEQPTITSMIHFPKTVTVAAHASQTFYTTMSFPPNNFNGIKMAGIIVKENITGQNTISYAIPMIIRGNIDKRPASKVSFGKFNLKQTNFHTFSLRLPIFNEKSTLLKDSQLAVKIINSNNSTVWSKSTKFLITPETPFIYNQAIDKSLKAGKYKVVLTINHEGQTWNSTQSLDISSQTAKKIAKTMPKLSIFAYLKNPIYLVLSTIFVTILLLILLILIYQFFIKKRKQNGKHKTLL